MAQEGKSAFFENDKETIQRQIETEHTQISNTSFEDYFEIQNTIRLIQERSFKNIALQFPDDLLPYSAKVSYELSKSLVDRKIFVLGDTSYGSCCVDEIAAEHLNADVVVHYGRACLSKTSRIPVIYVFGKASIDTQHCFDQLSSKFKKEDKIIIFTDVIFNHCFALLLELSSKCLFSNLIFSHIKSGIVDPVSNSKQLKSVASCCSLDGNNCSCNKENSNEKCLNCTCEKPTTSENSNSNSNSSFKSEELLPGDHAFCGRKFNLPSEFSMKDYKIFYIGDESVTLTNLVITYNQSTVFTYNPSSKAFRQENLNVNKSLMKRYYIVQKAKEANTIGIVVGTLGVAHYLEIIEHLKSIIKKAGKKYYTFIVGKLNVAKLANFQEIDIFVIVACPENSLIDSREFFKPIATPFELEVALVKGKEWTGEYTTDFSQILPGMSLNESNNESSQSDDEEVTVSLISGKVTRNPKSSGSSSIENPELNSETGALSNTNSGNSLIQTTWSPASNFLQNRSYKGLEPQLGQTEVVKAVEGRSGIPKQYEGEGKN